MTVNATSTPSDSIDAVGRRLAEARTIGIAIGILSERLTISAKDAEQALGAIAASDGVDVLHLATEIVRTRRLH